MHRCTISYCHHPERQKISSIVYTIGKEQCEVGKGRDVARDKRAQASVWETALSFYLKGMYTSNFLNEAQKNAFHKSSPNR